QSVIADVYLVWEQREKQTATSAEDLAHSHSLAARRGIFRELVLKRRSSDRHNRDEILSAVPTKPTVSWRSESSSFVGYGHVSLQDLSRFLNAPLDSSLKAKLVRHLLAGCPSCREQLFRLGWDEERLGSLLYLKSFDPLEALWTNTGRGYNYDQAFA